MTVSYTTSKSRWREIISWREFAGFSSPQTTSSERKFVGTLRLEQNRAVSSAICGRYMYVCILLGNTVTIYQLHLVNETDQRLTL